MSDKAQVCPSLPALLLGRQPLIFFTPLKTWKGNPAYRFMRTLQGGDVDFIVNSLLSDCAWGRLEPGPVWVPVGRLATDRSAL